MKKQLIKTKVGKHNYNGVCRICYSPFKKGEKLIIITKFNQFGKAKDYALCFNCLFTFILKEYGYKNTIDTLNKIVLEKI